MSYVIPVAFADCLEWLTESFASETLSDPQYEALRHLEATTDPTRLLLAARSAADEDEHQRTHDSGALVTLPPLRRDWLLLAHLRHGSEAGRAFLTFSLVYASGANAEHRSSGWRFEAPEGPGDHCYWHAQPLCLVSNATLAMPPWLWTSEPAIPVDASSTVEMLVAGLVAFYGHERFRLMQDEHGGPFDTELARIACA